MAERFGKLGLSYSEMAELLGVSKRTIQREFNRGGKSEFVTRYAQGKVLTKLTLNRQLLNRVNYSDTALMFALKYFCNFSDRPEKLKNDKIQVEITSGGKPVKDPHWLK